MLNNIGFVKTGIKFEGCDVYIGVKSVAQGHRVAPLFRRWLNRSVFRSLVPNMQDFYKSHFEACEQMKVVSGERE